MLRTICFWFLTHLQTTFSWDGVYTKSCNCRKLYLFNRNFNSYTIAGFVANKGFLFATASRKIKNHVEESQITLLVWSCLKHLQKNMAQLITWSFLMILSVSFTSAAFEAFSKTYLCLLLSALAKKMLR